MSLSAEELKALVSSRIRRPASSAICNHGIAGRPKGAEAGTLHKSGYRSLSIHRRKYYAHRLAWSLHERASGRPAWLITSTAAAPITGGGICGWQRLQPEYGELPHRAQKRIGPEGAFHGTGNASSGEHQLALHQGKGRFIGRFNTREEAVENKPIGRKRKNCSANLQGENRHEPQ